MKRLVGLIFILLLTMSIAAVHAQSEPLLIVMDGALYQWSGDAAQAVRPYTNCTPAERIVSDMSLSSGGRIAFLTEPQPVSDVIQQFGAVGGPLPSNIRICDGNSLTALATQPDNFSYFDSDVPDVGIARSTPTWSPDGTALAWTAFDLSTGALTIDIYNAAGDNTITSTALELPDFPGPITPPYITWANNGIYLFHATLDPETFAFVEFVFLYDAQGNQLAEAMLPPSDESRFVYDKFIMDDNGQEFVGLIWSDNVWELVDPLTGTAMPADGVGELYSKSGDSDISLLLTLDASQQYVWTAKNDIGIVIDVNGNNVAVPGVFPTSTDLSSSGQWVFQLFDGLYYWGMTASGYIDGTEAVTTGFSATAWSDLGWRVYRES